MTQPSPPDTCRFEHKLFSMLRVVAFRKAESDGAPALVVMMGDRQAALPLDGLAREFAITPNSHDGRMFVAVAKALDFVPALRLGDKLPAEVVTGEPSWNPSRDHEDVAQSTMRSHFVAWLTDWIGDTGADGKAVALADDPNLRARDNAAIEQAAETLGMANGEEVLEALARIASQLAFIEALRERLLRRAERVEASIKEILANTARTSSHFVAVGEVERLMRIGLAQLRERFDDVDERIGLVLETLRHEDERIALIRDRRDWLNRSLSAWEPLLAAWEMVNLDDPAVVTSMIGRTYQFLARRYLPAQEWLATVGAESRPAKAIMVW